MYRKGVSALIINSKDEFLIVNLNSFEEHFFAIPGGGQESNESLLETAYRELHEELGIAKEDLNYINQSSKPVVFNFLKPKIKEGVEYAGSEKYFFGFKFIGDDREIKLQANEVRAYKWVPFAELDKFLLFDNQFTETLEKLVELFPKFNKNKILKVGNICI